MSVWKRLLGIGRKNDPTLREAAVRGGLPVARSGAHVTAESALYVSTVLACCRVIANGLSQVPFRIYQDTDGSRKPASDHPLYPLLYRRPNPWQTSYELRETMAFHALLTGNAFVFINRVGSARNIKELVPLEPKNVEVKRNADMSLEYRVSGSNGAATTFGPDAIWHLRGPSWNSWIGLDAVKQAREAIGLAVTLEHSQAEFQRNGAQSSGILATKEKLSPERFALLSAWLDKHLPGGERFGKPLIADDGAAYTSTGFSAVDQQLIESRKMQISEICRSFGVWPIMVGHAGDQAPTFASAEQFFLAHVVHTLSPWYQRIEQSADVSLLSDQDREAGFYTKFTPNALMRGASNERANFYAKGLGAGGTKGWLTQNDVRALEDMDRSDDPEADKLPQPTGKVQPAPTEKDSADA